jgi:hypothetical protein
VCRLGRRLRECPFDVDHDRASHKAAEHGERPAIRRPRDFVTRVTIADAVKTAHQRAILAFQPYVVAWSVEGGNLLTHGYQGAVAGRGNAVEDRSL